MIKLTINIKNSVAGLKVAFLDKSFKLEIFLGILLAPLLAISDADRLLKFSAFAIYVVILVVELLNTALEKLCDRVTKEHDEDIKAVKDMGSAAVFLLILLLILIGCTIVRDFLFTISAIYL